MRTDAKSMGDAFSSMWNAAEQSADGCHEDWEAVWEEPVDRSSHSPLQHLRLEDMEEGTEAAVAATAAAAAAIRLASLRPNVLCLARLVPTAPLLPHPTLPIPSPPRHLAAVLATALLPLRITPRRPLRRNGRKEARSMMIVIATEIATVIVAVSVTDTNRAAPRHRSIDRRRIAIAAARATITPPRAHADRALTPRRAPTRALVLALLVAL